MGTRNLTMVVSNGKMKVAQYGQWDGYPAGEGATVLNFLSSTPLSHFKQAVKKVRWITKKEAKSLETMNEIPSAYSRDTGAEILKLIMDNQALTLVDSSSFAGDSLFCEWAYLIDLDNDTLEVYKGFNTSPVDTDNRFHYLQEKIKEREDKYYPVRLIKTYKLSSLPTEDAFINDCDPETDED